MLTEHAGGTGGEAPGKEALGEMGKVGWARPDHEVLGVGLRPGMGVTASGVKYFIHSGLMCYYAFPLKKIIYYFILFIDFREQERGRH